MPESSHLLVSPKRVSQPEESRTRASICPLPTGWIPQCSDSTSCINGDHERAHGNRFPDGGWDKSCCRGFLRLHPHGLAFIFCVLVYRRMVRTLRFIREVTHACQFILRHIREYWDDGGCMQHMLTTESQYKPTKFLTLNSMRISSRRHPHFFNQSVVWVGAVLRPKAV